MAPGDDNNVTANDEKIVAEVVLNDDILAPGDVVLSDIALGDELMALGAAGASASQPSVIGRNGFLDKGATKKDLIFWVRDQNNKLGGGLGNQGIGTFEEEVPPAFETGTTVGIPWARVKKGTGTIVVERSYTAVRSGDQGIATAGSFWPGKRVYVTALLSIQLDCHEQGHVTASEKIYNRTLKLAVDATTKYRDTPLMGKAGETEELVRARLDEMISWMNHRNEFINKDHEVNDFVGKFHAWETAQGGGPHSNHLTGATIDGVRYDIILRCRAEVEASYRMPVYQNYDPYAP